MGVVKHIVYKDHDSPPALPVAVIVNFESYSGPSFCPDCHCVPIVPI